MNEQWSLALDYSDWFEMRKAFIDTVLPSHPGRLASSAWSRRRMTFSGAAVLENPTLTDM